MLNSMSLPRNEKANVVSPWYTVAQNHTMYYRGSWGL